MPHTDRVPRIARAALLAAALIANAAPAAAETGKAINLPSGASIYFETHGAGRPLLAIHGGLGLDHTYFRPWLDPLAKNFQLVLPDVRGNGRSQELPEAEYTQSDDEWKRIWHTILPLYFHQHPVASLIANDKTIYRHRVLRQAVAVEIPKFDTRPDLAKLTMPTLVVVGRHDWVIPVRHSQTLYKGIPGAELAIFERSGHFSVHRGTGKVHPDPEIVPRRAALGAACG